MGKPIITAAGMGGSRHALSLQTTQIFDEKLSSTAGIEALPNGQISILVSVPERALLELASDIGKQGDRGQSLEEAINLMPSLRNLRLKILEEFLLHCTGVKVVKRVRDLGAASGYSLRRDLQRFVD